MITAVAAVLAGVLAQGFRFVLDNNRERERVRQVLLLEVAVLEVYLERIETLANAWQLPIGSHFWRQMDNAMRGYDELHTKLPLLPGLVRIQASAWFLKIKNIRLGAEQVSSDYAASRETVAQGDVLQKMYSRRFAALEEDARRERNQADAVYKSLFEAIPAKWLFRVGAGIEQKHQSLDEAQKEGEKLGLLPREAPES